MKASGIMRKPRKPGKPGPVCHQPPQATNQDTFFWCSPRRKKIVCHKEKTWKNDFQLNSPRLQCIGIQCLLKQLSEFDYLILPHNIMAVVTISPVILSCFNIKKCYVHVSVFMYISCVCICVCRFNSTIFCCSILRMYIYIYHILYIIWMDMINTAMCHTSPLLNQQIQNIIQP